ncbi:hypothetical protein lerEdw1_004965 [Lerista edwardsae]|nr:hypothetical protein lerEdw1_004965 [Lerista edwardsae]
MLPIWCLSALQLEVIEKAQWNSFPAAPVWPKGGQCQDSSSNARARYRYVHFSSPVQFAAKPSPCKARYDLSLGPQQPIQRRALRPCADPMLQGLRVSGMTCVPMPRAEASVLPCIKRPKMEIHIYVPKVKEIVDAESLDEGFLEDMDHQMTALGLQDGSL